MPSRYQKLLIPVLVLLVAVSVAAYAGYRSLHTKPSIAPVETASSTQQTAAAVVTTTVPTPATHAQSIAEPKTAANMRSAASTSDNSSADTISATLVVGDTKYALAVPGNTTLDDAMTKLAATNPSFTFTQHSYPGLGEFIDSINGKASTGSTYWILYVNGVDSQIGASGTIVHQGDTFEWKYQQ